MSQANPEHLWQRQCLVGLIVWLAGAGWLSARSITVDGVTYEDIRWGTVTRLEVSVIHRDGITRILLEKLPADAQTELGYDPRKAAADRAAEEVRRLAAIQKALADKAEQERRLAEWNAYRQDCETKALVEGKLIPRDQLTRWVCFIVTNAHTYIENGKTKTGTLLEVAAPVNDAVSQLAHNMQLRPNLWKSAGSNILHRGTLTLPQAGMPVEIIGLPMGEVDGWRMVVEPQPLTFEQWKALTGGLPGPAAQK